MSQSVPFFVSIPHSGEKIPSQAHWLNNLEEKILMSDVDRYVDRLYEPCLNEFQVPFQKTEWHRYAVDLNRIPTDISRSSVVDSVNPEGTFLDGYHWVMTKNENQILPQPMSGKTHEELTELIYKPFHAGIRNHYEKFKLQGHKNVFHIDAHSMPSLGTRMHRDPGERRADIVISDCGAKSCAKEFRDLVIVAYVSAGFKVGYNWPYLGGRVTEQYGQPNKGHHAIQVELNRDLYMNEETKQIKDSHVEVQKKIRTAILYIKSELANLNISG
jgi:N-formylglutamate amidohydrolase